MLKQSGFSAVALLVATVVLGISFQVVNRGLLSSWKTQKSNSQTYVIEQHRKVLSLFLKDPEICRDALSNREFDLSTKSPEDKVVRNVQVNYPGELTKKFSGTHQPLEEGALIDELKVTNFKSVGSDKFLANMVVVGRKPAGVGSEFVKRSFPLVVRTEAAGGNRKRIIDCSTAQFCDEDGENPVPPGPIVIDIPLECASVVFNSDADNKIIRAKNEKNCKITFDLADYYPPADGATYSKFEVDVRYGGWDPMAPEMGEGQFTNLRGHSCTTDAQSRFDFGWASKPIIELSDAVPGYYFASPNPTSPVAAGAGIYETNETDWLKPLYNGAKHNRLRVEYQGTSRHRFYLENKLNGWGSCSFNHGCGACMSHIQVKLYP